MLIGRPVAGLVGLREIEMFLARQLYIATHALCGLLTVAIIGLPGCVSYTADWSHSPEYRDLIGKCFVAKQNFFVTQSKIPGDPISLSFAGDWGLDVVGFGAVRKGERLYLRKYERRHIPGYGALYRPYLEVKLSGELVLADASRSFVGNARDISDPKRLEECDVVDGISKPSQKFVSKEFEIALPRGVTATTRTSDSGRMVTADFFAKAPHGYVGIYSIEWVDWSSDKPMSDARFYEYWDGFLPDYLTKNFGGGHYALMKKFETRHGRYPALLFVGTGLHNGEVPGSIYGTAVFMEHHMVIMYGLTDVMVARSNPLLTNLQSLDDLPGFEDFRNYSSSLKYRDEIASSGGQ